MLMPYAFVFASSRCENDLSWNRFSVCEVSLYVIIEHALLLLPRQ